MTALLLHPDRPVEHLWDRLPLLGSAFSTTWVGLLHPWTFGVMLVVATTNSLQSAVIFTAAPFQNMPVITFGAVGAALLLDALRRRTRPAVGVAGAAALVLATAVWWPVAEHDFPRPDRAEPAIARVDAALRPDDQVIASFGIVGRFADRRAVEWYLAAGAEIAVEDEPVVFVLSPTIGNMPTGPDQRAAAESLRALPGVEVLVDTPDVMAFRWQPPPGTTSVVLPVPSAAPND